jgi:hypothetical protein
MAESTKSQKTLKVRKKVQTETPVPEVRKSVKTLKLLKKVQAGSEGSGPIPGSLEEDFLLESGGDPKSFLTVKDEDFGPRYAAEGKLIPYSIIGPSDAFERQSVADAKTQAVEDKAASSQEEAAAARRFRTLRKVKTPGLTSQEQFQQKVTRVEEGKNQEKLTEKARLRNLPTGLKLIEERQNKCLKGYARMQSYWTFVSDHLAARSGKDPDYLVFSQIQDFREKIEELDYLDRAISSEEKAGIYSWYMSLRATKGGRDTYLPIGDKLSGLYTRIRERSTSVEPVIRRPSSHSPEHLHRSFKDYPYFQKRMKAEEMNRSLHSLPKTSTHLLSVRGVSKYEAELDVLVTKGVELLNLELIKPGEPGEEVLLEHYDIKFKY